FIHPVTEQRRSGFVTGQIPPTLYGSGLLSIAVSRIDRLSRDRIDFRTIDQVVLPRKNIFIRDRRRIFYDHRCGIIYSIPDQMLQTIRQQSGSRDIFVEIHLDIISVSDRKLFIFYKSIPIQIYEIEPAIKKSFMISSIFDMRSKGIRRDIYFEIGRASCREGLTNLTV